MSGWGSTDDYSLGNSYQRDGDTEYINLSDQISSKISGIKNKVRGLERIVQLLGTSRDTQETRNKMKGVMEDLRGDIKTCKDSIMRFARLDGGSDVEMKKRKMQQKKFSQQFQEAVSNFQKTAKVAVQKERDHQVNSASSQYDNDTWGSEDSSLIDDDSRRRDAQISSQIDSNQDLIKQRDAQVADIESTMTEVNEIFRDVAQLVSDQGETLDTIESNIVSADNNVEDGVQQLNKAAYYQKKTRQKLCCLLIMLACIAAIVAISVCSGKDNPCKGKKPTPAPTPAPAPNTGGRRRRHLLEEVLSFVVEGEGQENLPFPQDDVIWQNHN